MSDSLNYLVGGDETVGQTNAAGVRKVFGTAKIFYLGPTGTAAVAAGVSASDANPGTQPDKPFATLAQVVATAVAGRYDVCYVLEDFGRTTAVNIAAATTIAVKGLQFIGLGVGNQRPLFTFTTATTAKLTLNAASMRLENICFLCNFDAVAAMLGVTAADCVIKDCDVLMTNGASVNATVGLLTSAAASRLLVDGCSFIGKGSGAFAATADHGNAIEIVGGDRITIQNCFISGKFSGTLGCIEVVTTLSTNLRILNNDLQNWTTGSTKTVVDTITGTTGFIHGNRNLIDTNAAPFTVATMVEGINYSTDGVDTPMTAIS